MNVNPNKRFDLVAVLLFVAFAFFVGCASKPAPDPLAGWQREFSEQPNGAIVNDYKNYIQQLPPQERQVATVDEWLKDGTGQHAIKITVGLNNTNWRHV